jgi:hypothetical protein
MADWKKHPSIFFFFQQHQNRVKIYMGTYANMNVYTQT